MSDDEKILLRRVLELLEQFAKGLPVKSHYSVEDFAALVRREPFTVREWCRLGRIHAEKSQTHCGSSSVWVISHKEYERYLREGLWPRHVA